MGRRSLLVHFPGHPFALENLLPKRELAVAAADLRLHGLSPIILDFGTTEYVRWLIPKGFHENHASPRTSHLGSSRPWRVIQAVWSARMLEREWARARYFAVSRALTHISQYLPAESVTFYLGSVWDVDVALELGRQVRHRIPSATITAFGPAAPFAFAKRHEPEYPLHGASPVFNSLGNVFAEDAAMDSIPTLPCYDPDIYPALVDNHKFWVFRIPDTMRKFPNASNRDTYALEGAVHNEISMLEKNLGVSAIVVDTLRALHRREKAPTQPNVGVLPIALGFTLPMLRDTSRGDISFIDTPEIASLRIHSGSQRLLDQQFNTLISVSDVEAQLRTLREEGAYVVTQLDFPAHDDDYHSACETLRLLSRAKPDAAIIRIPDDQVQKLLTAKQKWRKDPNLFGVSSRIPNGTSGLPEPECRRPNGPWSTSSVSSSDITKCALSLRFDLEELGILTNLIEEFILVAKLSGYAAREKEFADLLASMLLQGDGAALTELAKSFQRSARSRAAAHAGMLFAERRAVGN
jgi:hypothetical protein